MTTQKFSFKKINVLMSVESKMSALKCWMFYIDIYLFFPQIGLQHYCFLVFFVVCLSVGIYIIIVLPETKNKSFVEIQKEFQSRWSKETDSDETDALLISTSLWWVSDSALELAKLACLLNGPWRFIIQFSFIYITEALYKKIISTQSYIFSKWSQFSNSTVSSINYHL